MISEILSQMNTYDKSLLPQSIINSKLLIIVNVAKQCKLASRALSALFSISATYASQGVRILLFPSSDFLDQNPKDSKDFKQWVDDKHPGNDFIVMEKINVKTSNLYNELASKYSAHIKASSKCCFNPLYWVTPTRPKWNYAAYILNKKKEPVELIQAIGTLSSLEQKVKKYL